MNKRDELSKEKRISSNKLLLSILENLIRAIIKLSNIGGSIDQAIFGLKESLEKEKNRLLIENIQCLLKESLEIQKYSDNKIDELLENVKNNNHYKDLLQSMESLSTSDLIELYRIFINSNKSSKEQIFNIGVLETNIDEIKKYQKEILLKTNSYFSEIEEEIKFSQTLIKSLGNYQDSEIIKKEILNNIDLWRENIVYLEKYVLDMTKALSIIDKQEIFFSADFCEIYKYIYSPVKNDPDIGFLNYLITCPSKDWVFLEGMKLETIEFIKHITEKVISFGLDSIFQNYEETIKKGLFLPNNFILLKKTLNNILELIKFNECNINILGIIDKGDSKYIETIKYFINFLSHYRQEKNFENHIDASNLTDLCFYNEEYLRVLFSTTAISSIKCFDEYLANIPGDNCYLIPKDNFIFTPKILSIIQFIKRNPNLVKRYSLIESVLKVNGINNFLNDFNKSTSIKNEFSELKKTVAGYSKSIKNIYDFSVIFFNTLIQAMEEQFQELDRFQEIEDYDDINRSIDSVLTILSEIDCYCLIKDDIDRNIKF